MIVISPTELRNNFKKYFDLANKERVIIQRGTAEIFELVKRERIDDPYFENPENVNALKRSLNQAKEGRVKKLTSMDDLLSKSSF
ncbi:MAG: type II toxin-antitoxin system Phd/YefM family antitoxin [Bacteroidales bacterium]|jgi:PHD/YefM family antitoxin component YafN of YafNO toxin-antitoxin module|nr:type II toxin-antitoxin system Phd/YefM family antitoxin [Bacteroidales bacterium]